MKIKEVDAKNSKEWRAWLKKNHLKETRVNLIVHKKHTGKKFLTHKEQIYDAICFGWIDTTLKRLDEDRYRRTFVRRNEKSKWSENTLRYGKEMIEKGLMSEFGLKMYNLGKSKPIYGAGIPKDPDTPEYLKKVLKKEKLLDKFESLSKSKKRMFLRWLLGAKQKETIDKRVKQIIEMVRVNGTLGVKAKDV